MTHAVALKAGGDVWLAGETIEAERAIAIEGKTGGAIRRHELRPDLFGKRSKAA